MTNKPRSVALRALTTIPAIKDACCGDGFQEDRSSR